MTDIVERLRRWNTPDCRDGADEIERLRAERDAAIAERDEARKLYAGEGAKAMALAEELSAARALADKLAEALRGVLDDLARVEGYGWIDGVYVDNLSEWARERRACAALAEYYAARDHFGDANKMVPEALAEKLAEALRKIKTTGRWITDVKIADAALAEYDAATGRVG